MTSEEGRLSIKTDTTTRVRIKHDAEANFSINLGMFFF
jgi:hypothetical protein